jgi:hypothetical protein
MPNMTSLSEFECSKDFVSKFEASDVTIVNGTVYAVCDSSWGISKFARNAYPPLSQANRTTTNDTEPFAAYSRRFGV